MRMIGQTRWPSREPCPSRFVCARINQNKTTGEFPWTNKSDFSFRFYYLFGETNWLRVRCAPGLPAGGSSFARLRPSIKAVLIFLIFYKYTIDCAKSPQKKSAWGRPVSFRPRDKPLLWPAGLPSANMPSFSVAESLVGPGHYQIQTKISWRGIMNAAHVTRVELKNGLVFVSALGESFCSL